MKRKKISTPGDVMHKKVISYSLLMLFALTTSLVQGQTIINPSVPKAQYLLETEQTRKAVAELESAVQANPTDAALLYYLGYAQLQTGAKDKAAATFDKGIALNEKEALNFAGKGWVLLIDKKDADAKAQFDKALTMTKSRNGAVLKAVAEAYLLDSKYSMDALALLKKAVSADNVDPEAHNLAGDVYLLQGNGGAAISSYERAAAIRATAARPHYKIGRVYQRSRNNEFAIDAFKKAIAIDPQYTSAYKELGELQYLMGAKEAENSRKNYETYLSLTENPHESQLTYAFILMLCKDYKKANEVLSKLADEPDVKVVTLRFYANSLLEDNNFLKSREVFEKYFQKAKKEDIEAKDYSDYSTTLIKLKQDSLAAQALVKSLELAPDNQVNLQTLGDIYMKTKKFEPAIDTYKKLISKRKDPKSLDFYSIGRAYYYSTQFALADSAFTKLISMQPEMVIGYVWEANTKVQQDPDSELGLAKPYMEKVIEKGSTSVDKNKRDLINAYRYLGYYYYLHKDYEAAKTNYTKLLELAPGDKDTEEALKILSKGPQQAVPAKKP